MAEKSYRIKTNVGQDTVVKASLMQDVDFLEVLSLKISQEDTYRLHVSNYGIIVGRVIANDAFGIPNVKVSVFIELSDDDSENIDITSLYPYKTITTKDNDNKRYNLLPNETNDDCHRVVGTFPSKRLVLDNNSEIEIYEKYWKYTTTTNQSGDYMIFGVPTGSQTVHIDVDLSDIGILSQKPRDFYYKGYNKDQFDSAEQFKEGDNLDNLTQLITQNKVVHVYPFFGDNSDGNIAITRCDVQVPYKFEPTCVFFGSIISDKPGHHIGHACGPTRHVGYNNRMTTGEGTIEMIRKTPDGLVEEFPIKGTHLIDGDGVWCYQIPMNLDYIGTDEFGNIVPVQDSTKGIPTRTSVRFRISMQETTTLTSTEHVAKYLVPNIHELDAKSNKPKILKGKDYDKCYEFGSATPNEYFRDLLWNKVYSVKNYIPRFEHTSGWEKFIGATEKSYMGVRSVNQQNNNNVFPFNSARFRLKFAYRVLCLLMSIVIDVIAFYNNFVSQIICWRLKLSFKIFGKRVTLNFGRPLKFLSKWIKCMGIKGGTFFEERADTYYFPKCKDCGEITNDHGLKIETNIDKLKDLVQQTLALEYDVVNFDFTNDWINGTLYMPLWFWKKRAKRKYFFGLFSKKAENTFCNCDKTYEELDLTQSCQTYYNSKYQPTNATDDSLKKRHKHFAKTQLKRGVIKEFTNKDKLNVYYYAPGVPSDDNYMTNEGAANYVQLFATDIILLGSLNNCDLDNLPKTFDSLPSSTVNLPFIATFNKEESGDGVVTGLDWGSDGADQAIKYQDGLLMDLTCWDVFTRYKSCVNLARLSELHVMLDMDINMENEEGGNIAHDGVITQKEIVENETRAKFASLNHNGLTNLTKNITTNYDTYKFHYIYPTNFDGHLSDLTSDYRFISKTSDKIQIADRLHPNGSNSIDVYDSNYAMYRLGEGKDSLTNGRHKKHFYDGNEEKFSFPLFNNSFYFYFGLHDGKTAIDKFNSLYNASCAKQNKYDFTIEYSSNPGKWCYNTDNISSDFGTIDIEFNGLSDTFSYRLINEFNEVLIEETDVFSPDLRFGYDIANGGGSYIATSNGYKKNGRLKYFKTGEEVKNVFDEPMYLENGVYYLEVTNAFGRKVTQKINMIQNVLSPNIEVLNLGTKYKHQATQVNDICGEMDYYGELKLKSLIIDGEEAYIKNMTPYFRDGLKRYYEVDGNVLIPQNGKVSYGEQEVTEVNNGTSGYYININGNNYDAVIYDEPNEVSCKIQCTDGSEVYLIMEPENYEAQDMSSFTCYGVGSIPSVELKPQGDGIYSLSFNIWKPGDYKLTLTQICNGVMNDNTSVNTFSIENGDNFQAFLNDVPLQIIDNNNFKNIVDANEKNNIVNEDDTFPRAWLQLENPELYSFRGTTYEDMEFWENFMDLESSSDNEGNSIIAYNSKIDIIKKQMEIIASMTKMAYIMGEDDIPQLTMTTKGGKEPILIRTIHPNYAEITENNEKITSVVIENNATIEAPLNYPHIVGKHYQNKLFWDKKDPFYKLRLNSDIYGSLSDKLGNYFAAFTNNGGIIDGHNEVLFDDTLFVESIPTNAQALTTISTKVTTKLTSYPTPVINASTAYFRNMFVDKRLIVMGDIWSPIYCNYDIYGNGDTSWKYGKCDLSSYNVAPMPYDNDYNIIGDDLAYKVVIDGNNGNNGEITLADLKSNKDIKLVSNLVWESDKSASQNDRVKPKSRLYKYLISVDGEETDIRDKFNYTMYGSEKNANGDAYAEISRDNSASVIIETQGSELSIEAANCKLTGDLTYEVNNTKTQTTEGEDDDANEVYTFKSHVESATEVKSSFDIGPRIEVKSFVASYDTPKNGHYIIFNNERIYLEENKTEYQTYNARYLAGSGTSTSYEIKKYEQQQEQSGGIKTETKKFELKMKTNNADSTCIYSGTTSGETISGYVLSVHTALTKEAYDELMGNVKSDYNGVKFSNNPDKTIQDTYYYEGDYLQDYLNKHGMPIYTNHFKSGGTAMDHCMIYGYNLNDLKVVGIGNWEEKGNNGFQEGNQTVGDNGVNTNKTAQKIFNYNTTYFGSYIYESSDRFYVKNEYAAFKITVDSDSNIDDIYIFYNYRDAQLEYEPRAMFYEIKENNKLTISIPTKITIKYNGNDVEYSMQKTVTSSAGGVMRIIFSGGTSFTSIQNVYDEPLSDGVEVNFPTDDGINNLSQHIKGTAEYNDLNDTWYFKCGNEYFPMYFVILYCDGKDSHYITNVKGVKLDGQYRGDFNFLSDGTVKITYDAPIYKNELPQSIDNIPQVKDEDGNYYCWVKTQKTCQLLNDGDTVKIDDIDGIEYKVYKALFNEYNPKRVEDFICKVMPDQYNTDYDSIESNPPKLLCSVIKSYGFNETTVKQDALRSNYLQSQSWVSSNSAIVNSDNRNLVNGVFLTTKSQAIVNNKLYNTRRLMPKCEGDEYVLDRSGNKIKMIIRANDIDNIDEYFIRFWDIALLHSIKNGETEFNGIKLVSGETAQKEATEIVNKKITWVDINHSKYEYIFNLINGPLSGTKIDVPPHYSIMNMGEFDCWDIKLQKYGEKYYFQGQTKIRNILNENVKYSSSRVYSNCNAKGSLPSVNSYTANIINIWYDPTNPNEFSPNDNKWVLKDKLDILNYFTESPVIGEIYTYIDLHAFGDIDQNGLFAFNDNSANEVFPGTGTIGRQYGHYEPLMVQHQNLQEVVSFRGIDGESRGGIGAQPYNEQERAGIGIYKSRFYKDVTQLSSYESIYESNELYDAFVFVYQPNVNNEILKGTQMLSCLLCNNYSNTNDDYRFRNTLVHNQSTSFSVAPVYVGEKVIDTVSGKVLVPIYLLNGMNEEIKKGLIENNLSYYVNGKEWIYQGTDNEYRNIIIPRSAKFYLTSDNNVAFISTKTLLINKYLEDSNLSCKIVDGDKKDMYFMNYNGLFIEFVDNRKALNNMAKLRIKKINPNEDAIKYYLRFVPTYYHEIGIDNNLNNDITITGKTVTSTEEQPNPLVGRPIYVALDAPLSSFTQYSYSASSGDGSTFINKNGISSSLAFTSSDSTTKIDNLYKSNCTCGEFFAEVIKMRNSKMMEGLPTTLDEWNTILEELKGESNKFMFTSKFKKDLFVMNGQEYFAYTNSDGENVVKPLFFQETALQYTGDQAFVDIQVNVGQTYNIIATRGMSVEFSDNNVQVVSGLNYSNYVIELIDPYSDDVLQTYQFNGFEANENHLRLERGDVDKEYVYGESTANRNDSILEEVNSVLASLKEGDYITIWDYRTRLYYPSSYVEDSLDGQVSCKTNIKNDEDEVFVCKHDKSKFKNNGENMIVYDRQNIFNSTSRYNGVEFYDFSSGENSERTIYNKNSDTVFIKYGKCRIDSEYIYQIICDDGYSVVGRSSEILTTVNSNGNKETFTYDEIVTKSILGLSLYHLSEVDGVYYEFVSKISRVIKLSNNDVHVLTYDYDSKNTSPTYMNLKVNNLIYKLQID